VSLSVAIGADKIHPLPFFYRLFYFPLFGDCIPFPPFPFWIKEWAVARKKGGIAYSRIDAEFLLIVRLESPPPFPPPDVLK